MRSTTDKFHQKCIVTRIGGLQSGNVTLARFAGIDKAAATPCETRSTELLQKQVGQQSGAPTITIRRQMDRHETVTKAPGDFIRRAGRVLDLILCVFKQVSQLDCVERSGAGWIVEFGGHALILAPQVAPGTVKQFPRKGASVHWTYIGRSPHWLGAES